jgi:hypothetical protein
LFADGPYPLIFGDEFQTQPQATVEVEISEDMQVVDFDFNRFISL